MKLIASFALVVLVIVASVGTTMSATAAGLSSGVTVAAGAPAALALPFLLVGLFRLLGSGRESAVARQFPDGRVKVFGSGRTARLKNTIKLYRVGPPETAVPLDFTVVCGPDALSLWSGSIANPVKFADIPWHEVEQATVDTVKIDERRSRGIAIETTRAGRLELQPLGQGFLAIFPLSKTALEVIVMGMHPEAHADAEHPQAGNA